MVREVVPVGTNYRIPEQGRIRLGVKTERAMKSIDKFRFTSSDKPAIEAIAQLYGGTVNEWTPPRSQEQQWEVITKVDEIRVFLPPNSINVTYEEWTGGGLVRRCDGIQMEIGVDGPEGKEMDVAPCWCKSELNKQDKPMACKPYTRLNVILPDIKFGGVWRLETKSWNAAQELPGMAQILTQLQAQGILEGYLQIDKREKITDGKKKKFIVPKLITTSTPSQILSGGSTVEALEPARPESSESHSTMELGAVVDAEIVEDSWDKPPIGVKVKKNPDPNGLKYVRAD
tara:strand:- start:129 stop:989 length:861 start_codon:yes stop_codon:yes gene_type:complete